MDSSGGLSSFFFEICKYIVKRLLSLSLLRLLSSWYWIHTIHNINSLCISIINLARSCRMIVYRCLLMLLEVGFLTPILVSIPNICCCGSELRKSTIFASLPLPSSFLVHLAFDSLQEVPFFPLA